LDFRLVLATRMIIAHLPPNQFLLLDDLGKFSDLRHIYPVRVNMIVIQLADCKRHP